MKNKIKIFLIIVLFIIVLSALILYWILYLKAAHSTFERYYNFRSCNELINKTDNYGFCKTSSGETIKIVRYQDKWYLDGDLPVSCWIIECP